MSALLITVHIIVCITLILIVLLQTGKGADMGAAFGGGGSQTLFGATGGATFLGKATTAAAVLFMLTSLTLAYISNQGMSGSIITDSPTAEETAPATQSDTVTKKTVTETVTVPEPGETTAGEPATADEQQADSATETADSATAGSESAGSEESNGSATTTETQ